MRCYWTYGECGVASVLDIQSLFFFEENWICAMTKHLAESSNINILFTTNFPFDSDVRQWIQPLIIPLHCLRTKSTNRTRVTRLGGEGVCLKLVVQGQGVIFGLLKFLSKFRTYMDKGVGVLKFRQFSWTSYDIPRRSTSKRVKGLRRLTHSTQMI